MKQKIIFKVIPGTTGYYIDQFFELHNHDFEESNHLKKARRLTYCDKEFIVRASTVKIGATRAYKMRASLKGGFDYVNGKLSDYKNFKRDLGGVISFRDAQLVVNLMNDRKNSYPNFSFFYKVDENKVLKSIFWADETDKAFYTEFGEVMSFDATFRTNK